MDWRSRWKKSEVKIIQDIIGKKNTKREFGESG